MDGTYAAGTRAAKPRPVLSVSQPISLVVTDLDGTLWDRDGRVHELTLHALQELDRRGIPVLAATGRRPASARQLMVANRVLLPAVVFDGSLGKDFATGATFHRTAFAPPDAAAVLEALQQIDLEPCVNIDRELRDAVVGRNPATHPAHVRFITPTVCWTMPTMNASSLPGVCFLAPVYRQSISTISRAQWTCSPPFQESIGSAWE